jgi:hypothetical protein
MGTRLFAQEADPMSTTFFVIGLPPSFTSEQLQQLLAAEADHIRTAEMLPDSVMTGVGYIEMTNAEARRRVVRKLCFMEHVFGVRLLICEEDSPSFHFLVDRWRSGMPHGIRPSPSLFASRQQPSSPS